MKSKIKNNGVEVKINPVNSDMDNLAFWKQMEEGKEMYGITIWGSSEESGQFDYDGFKKKDFKKFVNKCALLLSMRLEEIK